VTAAPAQRATPAASSFAVPPFRQFVARRFAAPSPPVSWMVFERIGGALAYLLAQFRTPPAVPTAVGGAVGAAGAVLLGAASDTGDQIAAGVLLLLSYVLDCTDGQLARATNRTSARGAWLDVATDATVIAFVTAALGAALLAQGHDPISSMLVAGAYGASRTVSLFTATLVRSSNGGIRLTGMRSVLRATYVALIDTPVGYVALCAARLEPTVLVVVMATLTVLTLGQALVSARHHFRMVGTE
jgi:phosphatidylglycerophosphate synthase